MHERTGVILLNLGGPDSLQAVKPFLYTLFSDREIIRLGPFFMQKPIAWLISRMRAEKTKNMYRLIGGKSPILEITKAQAYSLEKELGMRVYIGMRYSKPFIEDTVAEIYRDGIRRLIAISLYPHYSKATTGSALKSLEKAIIQYPIEYHTITSWFDHPLYISALVDVIKKGINSFDNKENVHLLFSAHSLPQSFIDEGDPYVDEIKGTIKTVLKEIVDIKWGLSYQSKSGPLKWLTPSTDEMLRELSNKGVKRVLVIPISFVGDHIETLYEIDILYKGIAEGVGIELRRTGSLNTHQIFISALKDIVLKGLKEKGWQ